MLQVSVLGILENERINPKDKTGNVGNFEARVREKWWAPANAVMNLRFPRNSENVLTTSETTLFKKDSAPRSYFLSSLY